jgi:hypothetical protein
MNRSIFSWQVASRSIRALNGNRHVCRQDFAVIHVSAESEEVDCATVVIGTCIHALVDILKIFAKTELIQLLIRALQLL